MRYRSEIDARALPTAVFGRRGLIWWGTLGFIATETTMFMVGIASYFYLRQNFEDYPPPPALLPDTTFPTINLLVLLASLVPVAMAVKAAKRFDRRGVTRWMVVSMLFAAAFVVLRVQDFQSLNTLWNWDAYGSATWMLVVMHTTHIVMDVLESGFMTVMFLSGRVEPKHFVDVEDGAWYWYFIVLAWIPIYFIVYLGPRYAY